jgi:hypothetical protein
VRVLDLFSGLGGFSEAFLRRGHEVVRVDIDPLCEPTICADILDVTAADLRGPWEIILASPPCVEFSRWSFRGLHTVTSNPDLTLVKKASVLINTLAPRWWCLENVRGSIPWITPLLGHPTKRVGSRYLWGDFPPFDSPHVYGKSRLGLGKTRAMLRAKIPYSLSLALCIACETYAPSVASPETFPATSSAI